MLIWINSCTESHRGHIFLDRDGVINHDRPDYIKEWREVKFYPDALQALRILREKRIGVVLISNQSAINRGLITRENFWDIHERMMGYLAAEGCSPAAAFYCPHRPDEHCACRKPLPGMLAAAAKMLPIPLSSTNLIGDRATDLEAARAAGCRPILLVRGNTPPASEPERLGAMNCPRYASLLDAVCGLF